MSVFNRLRMNTAMQNQLSDDNFFYFVMRRPSDELEYTIALYSVHYFEYDNIVLAQSSTSYFKTFHVSRIVMIELGAHGEVEYVADDPEEIRYIIEFLSVHKGLYCDHESST